MLVTFRVHKSCYSLCNNGYILNDFMDDTTLKVTTECIDRTWNQTINAQIMNDNLAGKMQTARVLCLDVPWANILSSLFLRHNKSTCETGMVYPTPRT